jgi:GNAT superfamily N-acetyltransferase
MYVAVDDSDAVVGFAVGGAEREGVSGYSGELHALYVGPSCQKSGVGRMLVGSVARKLHDQGHKSMVVWTLTNNAARGFYERLGGTFVRTGSIDIGGVDYEKVAYGWPDITVLFPSRSS